MPSKVLIIGAGPSGTACAATLHRLGHVAVGHGAKQHVIAAGLLLHGEAADGVEGGAEGHSLSLEGGLALGLQPLVGPRDEEHVAQARLDGRSADGCLGWLRCLSHRYRVEGIP